ncbi:MAG: T9SS type A sorting domain-containing protein [Chitinophagaceae bacterium]|nr:MAG: T9SS type A sorting domain-containing protein [Chitinophagaceae bacterium]
MHVLEHHVWQQRSKPHRSSLRIPAARQQPASTVVSEAAKAVQSEIKLPTSVIAFPNPSNGSFSLRLRGLSAGAVQVQVLNASGAVVAARQLTYGGKDESLPFQLGAVPAGLYTVRVTGRDGSLSTRIMIAR